MSNSKSLGLVVVVLVLLGLGCACLGGAGFFGGIFALLAGVSGQPKTYYAECEMLPSEDCTACCQRHGHAASASGAMINDDGKTCGCM